MKRNENGDFCVLYGEPTDEKSTLIQTISERKKPVIILLTEQARVFQSSEDFEELKRATQQQDIPIFFVFANNGDLAELATRHGFPVYASMEMIVEAVASGQLSRHRSWIHMITTLESVKPVASAEAKKTTSTLEAEKLAVAAQAKKTAVLPTVEDDIAEIPTRPFCPVLPAVHIRPTVSEPPFVPSGDLPFGDLPPVIELPQNGQPRSSRFVKMFVVLAIIALAFVSVGSGLISYRPLPTTNAASIGTPSIVGRVAFLSSEQISENSNQGLNDEVLVDLHNVPNPAQQKSYYAWLLGDKNQNDMRTIFLGNLPVDHENARLLYPGDQQHTNLLAFGSRLLVTEEDATIMPVGPSPDFNTWRSYGEIPQAAVNTPDATDNLSFLAHLRHLLASDPTLDEMGLRGGLNTWLYRNTSQVVELMSSIRQPWEEKKDVGFVRRQTMRTLVYLDGASFAARDLSANTALMSNERLARVGLLEVNGPNQDPPSYLAHFVHHLNGLLQTIGATPETRKNITVITVALNDVQFSLMRLRQDALTLINMNENQLRQPATLTLINDMISNARNALLGQVDPVNGQMHQGVDWIHTQMQQLATLNVEQSTRLERRR